jgi:hypothetical protein
MMPGIAHLSDLIVFANAACWGSTHGIFTAPCCLLQGPSKAAGSKATPAEVAKTPTLCLFERFERLTLGVTPATAPNTAAPGMGMLSAAPNSALGSAGSTSTAGSADSEQCAARVRPARRSVAFGTPSVLAYTPAQSGHDAAYADGDDSRTPLWSNAGIAN